MLFFCDINRRWISKRSMSRHASRTWLTNATFFVKKRIWENQRKTYNSGKRTRAPERIATKQCAIRINRDNVSSSFYFAFSFFLLPSYCTMLCVNNIWAVVFYCGSKRCFYWKWILVISSVFSFKTSVFLCIFFPRIIWYEKFERKKICKMLIIINSIVKTQINTIISYYYRFHW